MYIETKTYTIHVNHIVKQAFGKSFFLNQNHKDWLALMPIQSEYNDSILYFSSINTIIYFHR